MSMGQYSQILCDRETPKKCIKFLGLLSRLRDSLSLKLSSVTRPSIYSDTMDIQIKLWGENMPLIIYLHEKYLFV